MNKKIYLNTLEKQYEYDYDYAEIFTKKYDSKLRPKSIHCATSAKLVYTYKTTMSVFLLQLPIIICDKDGNIKIHTKSKIEEITLENKNEILNKSNMKLLRMQLLAVKSKKTFSSTALEIIKENELTSKLEYLSFLKKMNEDARGGGF